MQGTGTMKHSMEKTNYIFIGVGGHARVLQVSLSPINTNSLRCLMIT